MRRTFALLAVVAIAAALPVFAFTGSLTPVPDGEVATLYGGSTMCKYLVTTSCHSVDDDCVPTTCYFEGARCTNCNKLKANPTEMYCYDDWGDECVYCYDLNQFDDCVITTAVAGGL